MVNKTYVSSFSGVWMLHITLAFTGTGLCPKALQVPYKYVIKIYNNSLAFLFAQRITLITREKATIATPPMMQPTIAAIDDRNRHLVYNTS